MEENKKPLIKNWNNGISVAVWDRQNDAGKKYYTVSIQRKYNKGEDTITESMHIFPEDLLMLCEFPSGCLQTKTNRVIPEYIRRSSSVCFRVRENERRRRRNIRCRRSD